MGHCMASETVTSGSMQLPISLTYNRLPFSRLVDSLDWLLQTVGQSSTVICGLIIVPLHIPCLSPAIWLQGYCNPRHWQSCPLPLSFQTAASYCKYILKLSPLESEEEFPQSPWESHGQNLKSTVNFSAKVGETDWARNTKQTSGHCSFYQTTFTAILFYL